MSVFIRNIGLWFSFLVVSLSGFSIGVFRTHRMSLEILIAVPLLMPMEQMSSLYHVTQMKINIANHTPI